MKKYLLILLFVLLVVAHQDYWQWDRSDLIGGWLPASLFYHGLISIAASVFWLLVVTVAWPVDVEQTQSKNDKGASS